MMLLDDLNVIGVAQNLGSLADQRLKEADAQGHIEGFEDRDGLRSPEDLLFKLTGDARGGKNQRQLSGLAELQQGFCCGNVAEVNDHIGFYGDLIQT